MSNFYKTAVCITQMAVMMVISQQPNVSAYTTKLAACGFVLAAILLFDLVWRSINKTGGES